MNKTSKSRINNILWNNIWNKNKFQPYFPVLNAEYFYKYHLPKKNIKKFKILDLGCGNGVNLNFFNQFGYDCYGIDISKKCINSLKKVYKNKVKLNSFEDIDFKDNFFDAVFSHSSLYYGEKKNFKNGIQEVTRVLKKNGILRLYTKSKNDFLYKKYKKDTIKTKNPWEKNLYLTFFSKAELEKILKNYKNVKFGKDEFNLIDYKNKHSFWSITAIKK